MSEQLQAEGQDLQLFRDECLGSGSYGKVCKAKLNELPCAAKLLHMILFQFEDPQSQTIRRRFEQECEILKNTKHPNVVQYLGMTHDPQSGLPILLMELLDGNLTNFLEHREEPLPYHLQVNLWHDIALALTYLHSKQIIHRDLSGNNVLLIAGSRAKVTDFGMSRLSVVDASMSRLTQCPGTPLYMSPEALRIPPIYTDKLDVFSSGVVAVQIITRNYPAPGPDMLEVEDPNAPTGIMFAPIPEVERRKNHIDLIDPDHPMLPVIKNCLEDKDKKRPSAQQLCHQLVTLKQAPEYAQSVQQPTPQERRIQEQEQLIQEQQKQIQDQRKEKEEAVQQVAAMKKEIQELEQMQTKISKSEKAIQVLNTQLREKSLKLHLKKQELWRTQYNLQQKTEELEQKTAQQKIEELEKKTEEFRQKIEKVQGRLHQALQSQSSHRFQVNITELESEIKENQDPGRLVEQLPLAKKLDEKTVSHEAKLEAHGSPSAEAAQQKAGIDPMYIKMQKDLMEKHSLEQQKAVYERELAKLKEKLSSTSPALVQKPPVATFLEEEWEYKNRERLISTVLHANRLVQEANMLAHELNKETVFKVTLTVPRSFLSPRKMKSDDMSTSNEVAIRVLHKQRGTDSVWSLDQLEEKVLTMRDMYQRMEEEGRGVPMLDEPDPFYDLEQHALLGVANIYMEALHHDVRHEYDAPIIAPTGKECGKLKVAVQRVPTHVPDRDPGEDMDGDEPDWPLYEEVCELRSGVRFSCQVSVIEATGLPKEYCHYVYCQYHFWNQEEPIIIPPLVQSVTEKLPDGMQKFDHSQTFTVEVTEDFLEYLKTGVLAVEVWGHRRSGFIETGLVSGPDDAVEGRRPKSFLERWREHTHHLELWVEIMELNEQGEYESVKMQTKADVLTGGVFMIQQGQSRRINVLVNQREGAGSVPLKCGPIKSISIGSFYLRSRYDGPLDSYQGHDIERLRSKWCSAVANRREFLESELRKLMDRKGATVTEMERHNELLDQWAMLSWQRQALLEPRAGSGLPGAPTNWQLAPGMEEHVPVLFLDLNDDLLTPCDDDPVSAVRTGKLFAEKEDTMIELPIIKRDDTQPKATASWDSTVHDNSSLNKVTGSNDRVYAILKVAVALTHPPGIDLVLRKRICLRVGKRGFGSAFMKAIMPTGDVKTGCGVMFDVVTGIPKSEGMQRPPKIPANPSFMELDEDENVVEKFKTAMASISNILTLDRLKQEVALKEKLSSTGRALKKRYSLLPLGDTTPVTVSPSPCSSESEGAHEVIVKVSLLPSHALPSQPQSLSRADSGNIYNRAESPQMGDEKHEDDDMAKESADKMDQSEVPSVLTTSSEGEVVEGEVTQEEMQENSNEQEESVMKSQEAIPLLQEPPSSQVNLGRRYSGGDINPSSPVKHKPPPAPHSQRASPNLEKGRHKQAATSPRSRRDLSPPRKAGAKKRDPSPTTGAGKRASSPTPSTESESSSISESMKQATPTEPPPFAVGERKGRHQQAATSPRSRRDLYPPRKAGPKKRDPSPTTGAGKRVSPIPSTESESSSISESTPTKPPPFAVGDRVIVEIPQGFKLAVVKFIGETEFAPGEWIGVAFERPIGKSNGEVKGIRYFKCKDKHGLFVRRDKITITGSAKRSPGSSGSSGGRLQFPKV